MAFEEQMQIGLENFTIKVDEEKWVRILCEVYPIDVTTIDLEMNLSLITASTLSNISDAFKTSKYNEFPYVLFRDIVINEERILKALSK